MTETAGKPGHQPRRRRIGFQLAETMAAVSQMALLCPCDMAAWMQRELADGDPGRHRPEPQR
jgi:hypothetical protein